MKISTLFYFFCISLFLMPLYAHAGEDSFTQKDRELLIRIDERMNQIEKRFVEFREDMNKRFEQVDKRFEQVDKRFEQVDKQFEQVDKRFETIKDLMIVIIGAFAAIVAVAIGFAIWDRRTMTRPFEYKTQEIEKNISCESNKIDRITAVLKELAKSDKKIAHALRTFSLL